MRIMKIAIPMTRIGTAVPRIFPVGVSPIMLLESMESTVTVLRTSAGDAVRVPNHLMIERVGAALLARCELEYSRAPRPA